MNLIWMSHFVVIFFLDNLAFHDRRKVNLKIMSEFDININVLINTFGINDDNMVQMYCHCNIYDEAQMSNS